uniref:USP domain-containing protein n=1 Tax=Chromera velia CCMP2878 TaxID=1169474 RepID=A0A0G4H6B8_9ALVE|mmetsp:Transcript_55423/g.108498  ORF Transcript_55423/g.108498 Transcript_55423/m.108498 type:complete len:526 (+) Transcript_55423:161-1738(+)|eukprot:Cvel_5742.t1-p1 / transcript=Cvel_5742.t1 / gene=Cvel_5742 / organism=Chromera_velia_CCMP2878 / gene_product=U4/U6.U5 tri-snRNP-associated protein 2, putative / transcript_product=U4/U6.U5 tri-snRNP-associated protein 2, putative / location=Cvel_scaffold272:72059-80043(+) / protein_length=525 / sequence_SO=supercontig / SO=protein_coding / is_pseudo=false
MKRSAPDDMPAKKAKTDAHETKEEKGEVPKKEEKKEAVVKTETGETKTKVVARRECPYLGTINRQLLDFDFEKLCSITMSNLNAYCCLICGRYFQGRGKHTPAYTHALEEQHFVFLNLHTCKVYCLPENYEVEDASLNDIKFYLNPTFSSEDVKGLGTVVQYGKSLDGTDFLPGLIGLNNLGKTDFFNVVIQLLLQVTPVRNNLLLMDFDNIQKPDPVLLSLSELSRKIFNPKNFKGIVSPHEFLQAVGIASKKQFRIGEQRDPLALLSWLLARLHQRLKRDDGASVVHDALQGLVRVRSSDASKLHLDPEESSQPYLFLSLEVPPAPIFVDSLDKSRIPQVPIFDLLQKFDGEKVFEPTPNKLKRYALEKLAPFLLIQIQRFSKNNFFVEKNPTIVTFPVKHLDLADFIAPDIPPTDNPVTKYDLVANICHEGKASAGSFKIHALHVPTSTWYEIEDLRVTQVLPQQIAVSESYVQLYRRQDVKPDGSLDTEMRRQRIAELKAAAAPPEGGDATDDIDMFADGE